MKQLPISIIFHMKDGELVPKTEMGKHSLETYLKNIEEGTVIQITYEEQSENGTYAQISKVQACTRELANYLGYTHIEMKEMVKVKAGLYNDKGEIKSFSACTKEELSLAIQTVLNLGETVGFSMH